MKRRLKRLIFGIWLPAALAVAVALAWVSSYWWWTGATLAFAPPVQSIGVYQVRGRIRAYVPLSSTYPISSGFEAVVIADMETMLPPDLFDGMVNLPAFEWSHLETAGPVGVRSLNVGFPHWLVLLALGGWLALAWWRRHRRRGRHTDGPACGRCGYRLRGLPAGAACPECGEPAAASA